MNKNIEPSLERSYKIVRPDNYNPDEYLIKFLSDKDVVEKNYTLNGDDYIKPVNPDLISELHNTDLDHYVRSLIPDSEFDRVMQSDACAEISCNNLVCDMFAYYMLSKSIPRDWTVIDVGCAYNAQSYLFKEHNKYIGINPEYKSHHFHLENFKAEDTDYYEMTGQDFIKITLPILELDLSKTFAICTFVPDWECQQMVRETFKNCYVYYPHK